MSVRASSSTARARQQKAHQRVRREILLAAAGVFAGRGYSAATLADLAEAAGYAPPSLYRYFKSKEEIFSSLVELLLLELQATFELPVERGLPLAGRLGALLRAQIELVRARQDIFAVLMATPRAAEPGTAPVPDLHAGLAFYQARMTGWLRRHASRRELRCSFELAARALTGISHAFHSCHATGIPQASPTEEARLIVDLALHGFQAAGTSSLPDVEPQES
jgi:AcrR family transcriptional regulator